MPMNPDPITDLTHKIQITPLIQYNIIRDLKQNNQKKTMLQQILSQSKQLFCYRHKKEIATHMCIDIKCNNNPILCSQCISEGINRSYHYDHYQKAILPLNQAIDSMCQVIKGQNNPLQRIYKSTLGRADFGGIAMQLEKGPGLIEQLQNRITTIKSQVELQLQLLIKQFQKILLLQKQQYFKLLQTYQRTFIKNIEYLHTQTQSLIDFQTSLKYYSNKNNFYLKMASQLTRKTDWIIKTKKTLQISAKNIQNTAYTIQLNNLLSLANKIKLDLWPTWKGQDTIQKGNDLKFVIKRVINQWAFIPELKVLELEMEGNGGGGTQGSMGLIKNYYTPQQQLNGK